MVTLTTSGACIARAGANISSDFTGATAEAKWVSLISGAEGFINANTRYNWVDAFATLNPDVKYLLTDVASDLAALYAINYDMSGFSNGGEAQLMLNVLRDRAERGMELLKDQEVARFIQKA